MTRPGRKIRVVIADDHPMVREGLRSMLRAQDIEIVAEAGAGREAVEKAETLSPDVVLMDIRMPDMDGLTALGEITSRCPSTKVVVLTIYDMPAYLLQAVAGGAAGFILKGISRSDLLDSVRRVTRGESLIDRVFLTNVLQGLARQETTLTRIDAMPAECLTQREREVLQRIVEGLNNPPIANVLGISVGTVKTHVQHILGKLNVSDRTQAAVWAVRSGLIK